MLSSLSQTRIKLCKGLFELPENILGSVCREWLSVRDFCRLDTAMSDLKLRAFLEGVLKSQCFLWPAPCSDRLALPCFAVHWLLLVSIYLSAWCKYHINSWVYARVAMRFQIVIWNKVYHLYWFGQSPPWSTAPVHDGGLIHGSEYTFSTPGPKDT